MASKKSPLDVPENINFPEEELKILHFWKQIDAFRSSIRQSADRPSYTFYDGPPFATGLPHYGHLLAGTIKDTVTRWAHQTGHHVDRRFGWDCHGLPVEYEIDKTLGITSPNQVLEMTIKKYNDECRSIVMRYSNEWEHIVNRMGRWIDFENDYKTMYPWFMESVWWVFKQLYEKGLVYRGFKVMPYSTACHTPLSNFEAGQNYKDVQDPAIIVSFPLDGQPDVALIAWTTTPWTLPSNMALCVHPELDYVKIKEKSGRLFIMMKARLASLFKSDKDYEILETFPGKSIQGLSYQPLFPYYAELKSRGAFRVLCDKYVTEETGTGVVHQAPYFGEDDNRVCLANKVISVNQNPIVCPVDDSGLFTAPVVDFQGEYVKDADKNIIRYLKEHGRLINQSTLQHSYPFCWRSETPLLYKAVPSWFVRVQDYTDQLLACNKQTYWVPESVKEKRFANWLASARDWAISRNRFWGTPIPLWVSDDLEEVVCVGSIEELEQLSGVRVADLHRETVDPIEIPSRCGKGMLRRISEVFDCWFESGSMPYAQVHYPFTEKRREFDDNFPADFIAEGIDQCRGWFYTLLVLSTLLFGKPPFKNLIVNGLVLAEDGEKMSKRKKNYPDPMKVVDESGADALRLYLVNSPAVRADNLRFREKGVRDILKDVFLPWYNAFRFLMQRIQVLRDVHGLEFRVDVSASKAGYLNCDYQMARLETGEVESIEISTNEMDVWILSFTNSLLGFVRREMAAYRLNTVLPRLTKYVDQLTNWYIKLNRKRLRLDADADPAALRTLYEVLLIMVRVMAPFVPFISEHIYQGLRRVMWLNNEPVGDALAEVKPGSVAEALRSVHFQMVPFEQTELVHENVEANVARMQQVVELARTIRDRNLLPLKQPLRELVVIHHKPSVLSQVMALESYVKGELNVRKVTTSTDKKRYGVVVRTEPDHKVLGSRLKSDFKRVMPLVKTLSEDQLAELRSAGSVRVTDGSDEWQLHPDDVRIMYQVGQGTGSGESKPAAAGAGEHGEAPHYEAHSDGQLLVLLDTTKDETLEREGLAREFMNRVQRLRKAAKLLPTDPINVFYEVVEGDSQLNDALTEHKDYVANWLGQPVRRLSGLANLAGSLLITRDSHSFGAYFINIGLARREPVASDFVNVIMVDSSPTTNGPKLKATRASVLLENPRGVAKLNSLEQFYDVLKRLGPVDADHVYKWCSTDELKLLKPEKGVPPRYTSTTTGDAPSETEPLVPFVNVRDDSQRSCSVFLENPAGRVLNDGSFSQLVGQLFGSDRLNTLFVGDQKLF